MAFPKYQTKEVLNKVLNSGETALQVDIVAGAEYAEDSEHTSTDTGNFVLGVRNDTLAALGGTDGDYVPFQMNASGALFVEVSSSSGDDSIYVDDADWTDSTSKHTLVGGLYQSTPQSITDGDTGPLQVNANGNLIVDLSATDNAVLDAIDAVLDTIKTDTGTIDSDTDAIKTAVEAVNQAAEGTISATTQRVTIATDDDGVAHLATIAGAVSTQMQVDIVADGAGLATSANQSTIIGHVDGVETLLGTIDSDTDAIKTATESSNTHLGNLFYDTVVSVTPHDTNPISAGPVTYYALWVGTGGNVKVTLAGSGTQTFNNVASGQLLPIVVTHVFSTNTTALNILALK